MLARLGGDPALARRVDAALPRPAGASWCWSPPIAARASARRSPRSARRSAELAERADVEILFPLHPNPELRAAAERARRPARVRLLPPLDLPAFVRLMQRADLVLTDSGGVQEEAVALGKPVLVLRDATERPEGIEAARRCASAPIPTRIVDAAEACSTRPPRRPSRSHLYGDGRAADADRRRPARPPGRGIRRDWPRIEGLRRIG